MNKILLTGLLLAVLVASCKRTLETSSHEAVTAIPFIGTDFTEGSYGFGLGSNMIFKTVPDTIGILVDSLVGFSGGFGGTTGKDSIYVLKTDLNGPWPDTMHTGGSSLVFEKYNLGNYKASIVVNIVIEEPIAAPNQPGPTDISGIYLRAATGVTISIIRIFDGVYLLTDPGGAGLPPYPYVLKNYKSSTGTDSLSFAVQENPCGGGLQLVAPGAPLQLPSENYTQSFPPGLVSRNPVTLSWRVLEFPAASAGSVNTGAGICQWGVGARTFVKQ